MRNNGIDLQSCSYNMIKENNKMIKEKYKQLLLSHQIRGITTIGDTHKLAVIAQKQKK